MRIAAIADIHGNVDALSAVLSDISKQSPDLIVNLGDVLSGPLFPADCADLLIPLAIPTVRGNHERQLLTMRYEEMSESDKYTISHLQPHHLTWIETFPGSMALPEGILLMHGSPGSDAAYLLETVEQDGVRDATSKEVQGRLEGVPEAIILCGHSHLPKTLELDGGCLIVNPGSVGLQGYEAQEPHSHKMEAGSPQARYATLDRRGGIWSARLHTVNYDWERAYKAAYQNGRLDWARALKFGRV